MNKKNILFAIILIFLISFIFWRFAKNLKKYMVLASVSITTQKNEYSNGENLKVKITNKLGKTLCFSTCYPFLLEKKDKTWEGYKYIPCDHANVYDNCVENDKTKAFELTLPKAISGVHRLAIPACSDCKEGEAFREESVFYSNEFSVK